MSMMDRVRETATDKAKAKAQRMPLSKADKDALKALGYSSTQISKMSLEKVALVIKEQVSADVKSRFNKSTGMLEKMVGAAKGPGSPGSPIFDVDATQLPESLVADIQKLGFNRTEVRQLAKNNLLDDLTAWVYDPQGDKAQEVLASWTASPASGSTVRGVLDADGSTVALDSPTAGGIDEVIERIDAEDAAKRAAAIRPSHPTSTQYLSPMGMEWERRPADVRRPDPKQSGPWSMEWERPSTVKRPPDFTAIGEMEEGETFRRGLRADQLADDLPPGKSAAWYRAQADRKRFTGGRGLVEETMGLASRNTASHALLETGKKTPKGLWGAAKSAGKRVIGSPIQSVLGLWGAMEGAEALFDVARGGREARWQAERGEMEARMDSLKRDVRLQYRVQQAQEYLQKEDPTLFDMLRGLPARTSNEIVVNAKPKPGAQENMERMLVANEVKKDPMTFAAHFRDEE